MKAQLKKERWGRRDMIPYIKCDRWCNSIRIVLWILYDCHTAVMVPLLSTKSVKHCHWSSYVRGCFGNSKKIDILFVWGDVKGLGQSQSHLPHTIYNDGRPLDWGMKYWLAVRKTVLFVIREYRRGNLSFPEMQIKLSFSCKFRHREGSDPFRSCVFHVCTVYTPSVKYILSIQTK